MLKFFFMIELDSNAFVDQKPQNILSMLRVVDNRLLINEGQVFAED